MCRPRPSRNNKSEPHVKVTRSHDILCGHPLSAQVLHKLFLRHHARNMGAIYSTYAVLEVGIEPRLLKSRMNYGSTCLIMSTASFTREFKTLMNMADTLAIDLSNLSSACLTD